MSAFPPFLQSEIQGNCCDFMFPYLEKRKRLQKWTLGWVARRGAGWGGGRGEGAGVDSLKVPLVCNLFRLTVVTVIRLHKTQAVLGLYCLHMPCRSFSVGGIRVTVKHQCRKNSKN